MTDPAFFGVMLVIGCVFLGFAGLLEWWAARNPRVNDWADRIVERLLG